MMQGQDPAQGGGGAGEMIQGVIQATQVILQGVVEAPGVPDEAKQALAQATDQYIGILGQIVGGGAPQGQPQPQQVESMPGGRPVTQSGV